MYPPPLPGCCCKVLLNAVGSVLSAGAYGQLANMYACCQQVALCNIPTGISVVCCCESSLTVCHKVVMQCVGLSCVHYSMLLDAGYFLIFLANLASTVNSW